MRVFKIPYASDGLRTGVESGPDAIVAALEAGALSEAGAQQVLDAAAIQLPDDSRDALALIEQTLSRSGQFIALGGDHGLSFAAFRALASRVPGSGIISLSARPDCHRPLGIAAREDWLRALMVEAVLPGERAVIAGLRAGTQDERQWLRQQRIHAFEMQQLAADPVGACDDIMELARTWPAAYLSIDLDVLDPAFAPGVNEPEPGGLSTRELLGMVQRLRMLPNLAAADIVEANPQKDLQGLTQKVAAKVLGALMG